MEANEEKKLREKFVSIMRSLRPNCCYTPKFGSSEYWNAEKMADKGWFDRVPPPFSYARRGSYNPSVYS
jgi:hypothetical protein